MALYDESHNQRPRNVFDQHKQRPFKQAINTQRERTAALTSLLDDVAMLDQYPAKRVPFSFSKRFAIPLTSARHVLTPAEGGAGTGFEALAPVADLQTEIEPENGGDVFVNREGPFYLTDIEAYGYVNLTFDSDPGFAGGPYTTAGAAADIFDSALRNNGGALSLNYFRSHPLYTDKPNMSFDVRLRDKQRGVYLHSGRLSAHEVKKEQEVVTRFDPNTTIEPRIRILEARMGNLLDTDQAFNAAQFRGWVYIILNGYKVLES